MPDELRAAAAHFAGTFRSATGRAKSQWRSLRYCTPSAGADVDGPDRNGSDTHLERPALVDHGFLASVPRIAMVRLGVRDFVHDGGQTVDRRTATLAAGILVATRSAPLISRAQQAEPQAKAPKPTLTSVESQVTDLQTQVSSLQSTVTTLQSAIISLQKAVISTTSFARVFKDGTLLSGSTDATGVSHVNSGIYRVRQQRCQ
jgi:hypothetical protein